ncbi:hypothetical protein RvVAR0630_37150 [Agrobacterium vitis]|uniref:cellulose biosynthesis protein BcsN n=1 Tax=Agrobacterium vitis TaxID=373 RepID=UPI0015D8FD69|nr:cellulose biosynthesis protein BcsN [Agrobacterium vitis]BCH61091.1 hypothetical protein RvVAR0630_37150 [Agrobacterium vitis]
MILDRPILAGLLRGTLCSPALVLVAFLSACAGNPVRLNDETRALSADQAMLLPPPGDFSIVGVTQKRFSNAVQQEIALSTNSTVPGQNVVQVRFYGTENPSRYGDNALSSASLTDARINSEMRGTLPGLAMTRAPYVVQNDFGPFGYAVGRSSGNDLCLYAWQQLRARQGQRGPFVDGGTVQIRMRLCDKLASEQQLLSLMYGFTLAGTVDSPGWNPYGGPPPLDARLGGSSAPIYPPATPILPVPAASAVTQSQYPTERRAPRPAQTNAAISQSAAPGSLTPNPRPLPAGTQNTIVPSPGQIGGALGGAHGAMPSPNRSGATSPSAQTARPGSVVPSPACMGANSDQSGSAQSGATQAGQCP